MKVEYIVNNKGELYSFKTSEEEEVVEEFKIPSTVGGVKIESIGNLKDTFRNLYAHGVKQIKKLIIENGIKKMAEFAFADIVIEIDTVYWPKSCTVIPLFSFSRSNIKSIVGVENVEKIELAAFQETLLKYFNWPERCKVVSSHCFYKCHALEQLVGLEEVADIGIAAFNETALKTFCWPASVSATETCLFLLNCEHLEEINFGGVGIKDVDLACLSYLKDVKKIDLSGCGAVNLLNCSSEEGCKVRDKVVLPYYVTEVS